MHRSAPRLSRILACAAVPVMLVAVGCSSDSGSDGKKNAGSSSSGTASSKPSEPTVEPAKFADLPDPCTSIGKKTIEDLVPEAKKKGGTAGGSSDLSVRSSCSWNGLDDQGVKGSQYHWMDVGFTRFDSDQALGSGAKRATEDYAKQVTKTKATEGAKKAAAEPAAGIGEEATLVTYGLSKTDEDFVYATVVARTGNVVVTLTYNGAGYAGAKTPSSSDIVKGAQKAAKEAIAAVGKTAGSEDSPAKGDAKTDAEDTKKDDADAKGDAGSGDSPKSKATPKS
ncbi:MULTISPECIES: DUF3558 domain-containing protein [Streptomyces]|uniref:DUF3558 domain-containing protein n=1 Tax=Streptomyces rubiginosohelvolus TaxID=67362 RepID=A0ABQ3C2P4_9ACTN|nr:MULTISPECIES: DUF3558 domain-containing protein [Streptomyces]RUP65672.1 hypothetical protein SSPNP10_25530 [Streptomyces sp. NP10]WST53997.1 DUF3558 domain-containing protein [Streptomyces rubiginosohelvolus]GGS10976.1 hypothetical protein GCM10010284_50410 [Streptomyces rubiginosohelvolus]GGZ65672.1 hypothetical protein GCM10010328_45600 [Streptomyces pluricolorescens]